MPIDPTRVQPNQYVTGINPNQTPGMNPLTSRELADLGPGIPEDLSPLDQAVAKRLAYHEDQSAIMQLMTEHGITAAEATDMLKGIRQDQKAGTAGTVKPKKKARKKYSKKATTGKGGTNPKSTAGGGSATKTKGTKNDPSVISLDLEDQTPDVPEWANGLLDGAFVQQRPDVGVHAMAREVQKMLQQGGWGVAQKLLGAWNLPAVPAWKNKALANNVAQHFDRILTHPSELSHYIRRVEDMTGEAGLRRMAVACAGLIILDAAELAKAGAGGYVL
jgi:hypothetical protein